MIMVCDRMGWTFHEYLEQPTFFIDALLKKWELESDFRRYKDGIK